MAMKFRTTGPDVLQPSKHKPEDPPGTLPSHRIAVLDHLGRMRGNVSRKAMAVTASRFIGGRGVTLTKHNGKTVWKGMHP